jgi:hypothetical protein
MMVLFCQCVSDCAEATIGAYLLSCGPLAAASLLVWFEILPAEINHVMTSPAVNCIYEENLGAGESVLQAINKHLHRKSAILNNKNNKKGVLTFVIIFQVLIKSKVFWATGSRTDLCCCRRSLIPRA